MGQSLNSIQRTADGKDTSKILIICQQSHVCIFANPNHWPIPTSMVSHGARNDEAWGLYLNIRPLSQDGFPWKLQRLTENSKFQRLHWRPRKGWMIPSWQPPESLRKHSSEFLLKFLELLETGQVPQAQEDYDAWVGTTLWILVDGYWRLKNGAPMVQWTCSLSHISTEHISALNQFRGYMELEGSYSALLQKGSYSATHRMPCLSLCIFKEVRKKCHQGFIMIYRLTTQRIFDAAAVAVVFVCTKAKLFFEGDTRTNWLTCGLLMWRPALDTKTLRTAEFVGAGLFVFFWVLDVHPPTRKYLKEVVDTKFEGQSPQTSPNIHFLCRESSLARIMGPAESQETRQIRSACPSLGGRQLELWMPESEVSVMKDVATWAEQAE